jgi:hypothetical protein
MLKKNAAKSISILLMANWIFSKAILMPGGEKIEMGFAVSA